MNVWQCLVDFGNYKVVYVVFKVDIVVCYIV